MISTLRTAYFGLISSLSPNALLPFNSRCSSTENTSNSNVVSQLSQELGERDKRPFNAIVHGLPESSSSLSSVRVADDVKSLSDLAQNLSFSFPSELKLFKLGSNKAIKPRPLKIIFTSKELALRFVSDFNTEKHSISSVNLLSSISVVRDYTLLERKEILQVYSDLAERQKKGERNIAVRYRNDAPYVSQVRPSTKADDLPSTVVGYALKKLTRCDSPFIDFNSHHISLYSNPTCILCTQAIYTLNSYFNVIDKFKIPVQNINFISSTINVSHNLNIYWQNVRGLRSKLDLIRANFSLLCNFNLVILTN